MSSLEKKIYLISTLCLPLCYFIPQLWSNVFDSKSSFAAERQWVAIIFIVFNVFVWGSITGFLMSEALLKIKGWFKS